MLVALLYIIDGQSRNLHGPQAQLIGRRTVEFSRAHDAEWLAGGKPVAGCGLDEQPDSDFVGLWSGNRAIGPGVGSFRGWSSVVSACVR